VLAGADGLRGCGRYGCFFELNALTGGNGEVKGIAGNDLKVRKQLQQAGLGVLPLK
jgi:hypothetical protein